MFGGCDYGIFTTDDKRPLQSDGRAQQHPRQPDLEDELDPEEHQILTVLKEYKVMSARAPQATITLKKGTLRNRLNHLVQLKLIKKRYNGPKTQYQFMTLDEK